MIHPGEIFYNINSRTLTIEDSSLIGLAWNIFSKLRALRLVQEVNKVSPLTTTERDWKNLLRNLCWILRLMGKYSVIHK